MAHDRILNTMDHPKGERTTADVQPVSYWGRKPLYMAKIGTTSGNLIMVRRIRKFCVGQSILFAAISDVEGMSVGCTPAWRSGIIWKIENNRLFVESF